MESTLKLLFNIMPLVDIQNPEMAKHIQKSESIYLTRIFLLNNSMCLNKQRAELGVIFCLSWLITWYSHVMDNLQIILRLYDFFIVSDPLMPVYLGAIVIIWSFRHLVKPFRRIIWCIFKIVSERAEEILNIDCDMASLHTVISKYPSQIENIELIERYIAKTVKLFEKYPPHSLTKLNENWLDKW